MHVFRRPPESQVRRLLGAASLPTADLTPGHFEHFFGCGTKDAPAGVVGLEIHGSSALLRSLVVDESARGRGCGVVLVAAAERHALECGVERVYLLTTTAAKFFEGLGYVLIPREKAPERIRATSEFTSLCPSSSACMMKHLAADPSREPATDGGRG